MPKINQYTLNCFISVLFFHSTKEVSRFFMELKAHSLAFRDTVIYCAVLLTNCIRLV